MRQKADSIWFGPRTPCSSFRRPFRRIAYVQKSMYYNPWLLDRLGLVALIPLLSSPVTVRPSSRIARSGRRRWPTTGADHGRLTICRLGEAWSVKDARGCRYGRSRDRQEMEAIAEKPAKQRGAKIAIKIERCMKWC